jgi:hypothetical protein
LPLALHRQKREESAEGARLNISGGHIETATTARRSKMYVCPRSTLAAARAITHYFCAQ